MVKRIMVVEDTKVLAKAIADSLRMEGFDVAITFNGRLALKDLERSAPDLIITDLVMPQMDGLEFTRRLRLHPGYVQTPVIIISAQVSDDVFLASKEAGANLFFKKPFDQDQLIDSIYTLLNDDGRKN